MFWAKNESQAVPVCIEVYIVRSHYNKLKARAEEHTLNGRDWIEFTLLMYHNQIEHYQIVGM